MNRPATCALWAALCLAATLFGARQSSAADLQDTGARLVLKGAMPGERDLLLRIDGEHGTAFADAPTYNRAYYPVTHTLKVTPDTLQGTLQVRVMSDGWVPKGVDRIDYELLIDVQRSDRTLGGNYEGTFGAQEMSGRIEGELVPTVSPEDILRAELKCENVYFGKKKGKGGRATMIVGLRNGRAHGAKMIPPGSITDVAYASRFVKQELSLRDGRLQGTLAGPIRAQNGNLQFYRFEIDGLVVGTELGGTINVVYGDIPEPGLQPEQTTTEQGTFLGELTTGKAPPAGDALYKLTLHDAVRLGGFIDFYATVRDGRFIGAFATTPNFNNATHEIALGKLELQADENGHRVVGSFDMTLHPDPWIPKDHKPVSCRYALDVQLHDGELTGSYTGTFGDQARSGPVDGLIRPLLQADKPVKATIKVEDAIPASKTWYSRAFLTMEIDGGRVTGGKVWNNHSSMKGTVDSGELVMTDGGLLALVRATLEPAGGVRPGKYVFLVRGDRVGSLCAGSFQTWHNGRGPIKNGRFWATLGLED